MSQTAESPYGRRLVNHIVDDVASKDPGRPFIFTPRTSDPKDDWTPLTYGQLANAVNHVSHIIYDTIKTKSSEPFPTLAYIGPGDARYLVVQLACVKAGCQAFLISPRNSIEGQVTLLERMRCINLWYAASFEAMARPWLEIRPMMTFTVPELEEWIRAPNSLFPYDKTFDEAEWDPLVVLHTSGATGTPKSVIIRQGSLATCDGYRTSLPDYAFARIAGKVERILAILPMFHAGGILLAMSIWGIYYGKEIALPPPGQPLSSQLVRECLNFSGADSTLLPPTFVSELSQDEQGLAALKKLKYVTYAGGSLPRQVGEALIKKGVSLQSLISSTEAMTYALLLQDNPQAWQYFKMDSAAMGAEFRLFDEKEHIYKMVFKRNHPTLPCGQPVFYAFPEADEFDTGDLYRKHPELPDHWQYYGRHDDIIVFINGEKLNPTTIQSTLEAHPAVKGALVVGQERFQSMLLLEPQEPVADSVAATAFIDDIWPMIEEINNVTVAHGRLVRRLVMVSDPAMPFSRTPKGSVARNATITAYKDKIDQLYRDDSVVVDGGGLIPLDFSSEEALTASTTKLIATELMLEGLQPDMDIFTKGVDSLQVISIGHALRSSAQASGVELDAQATAPRVIYANPSPVDLAKYLFATVGSGGEVVVDAVQQDIQHMEAYLAKYTSDLPAPRPNKPEPRSDGQAILLTGTTGSLGAYMLDRLCSAPNVAKIYALNRCDDGGKLRQGPISTARGLATDFSKVEFLRVNLALPGLGLESTKYIELLSNVDRIIHNAWPVNFNISVATFEPSIQGVRHLADLSHAADKQVPLIFLSSASTVDNWKLDTPVPEERFEDLTLPSMGYGRSKHVGSLILDAAASRSGVPAVSVRVGQIAGPKAQKGRWNVQEMVPTLIASSLCLGLLPNRPGRGSTVDWVPIEDVAGTVIDLAGITAPVKVDDMHGYFHLVNPHTTTWAHLIPSLREYYGSRIKAVVDFPEWVAALEQSAKETTTNVELNPGIKLLDTFRNLSADAGPGLVSLDTTRTAQSSPTMAEIGPITPELLKSWCGQWGF